MTPTTSFRRIDVRPAAAVLLTILVASLGACSSAPPIASPPIEVVLIADGQTETIETEIETVSELLRESGIAIGEWDRVNPPEVSALETGMTIRVIRVRQETEIITQTIPFGRQVVRDANVREGESRLLQSGQVGRVERHYLITYEDDTESDRALVREVLVQKPQDEVRLIGTKGQRQNVPIVGTLTYLSNQDAWLMRDSSFQTRRLTSLGDLDGRVFTLSPDGERLLLTRTATETDVLNELWIVATTEAAPNPVPLNVKNVLWAGWAPDDEIMAWTTAEVQAQAPGWRGQNDLWQARVTRQNTLASRREILSPEAGGGYGWWGTRYVWAPDGKALAYSRPESVGLVTLADRDTTTLLTFPAYRTFSSWSWNPEVAWSPDGLFLATLTHHGEGLEKPEESPVFNLVQIAAEGNYSATLAVEVGMWAAPHFSPDGQWLLFGRAVVPYQSSTSTYNLYLADRDGSGQMQILAPGAAELELPLWRWRPDGQGIAFVARGDIYWLPLNPEAEAADSVTALTEDGGVTMLAWR